MTPSAQDIIAKACNIPTFKLSVIPHPNYVRRIGSRIDRKAARKLLGIPNDAVIIGFCGAIREYKGIDLLIRAFREIKNRSIELLIAGEPESSRIHNSILKEIESCEEKRITFIPRFLSEDELATWLTAIDLTVLPYRKILNSGSLLYSLSLGVPVVIPQVQELSDFIGLPGVLPYTPRESSSLREVIEGYFENGEMNAAIESQARSTAQAFDPREVALHYYKLFSRREAQYFFPKIKVFPETTTSTQPIG
jgi:glycosyltransferase involved in cell wall biosynthesis